MEPSSRSEALAWWGAVLLPERDLEATIDLLEPMASRPGLAEEVEGAIGEPGASPLDELLAAADEGAAVPEDALRGPAGPVADAADRSFGSAQAVGLLLGSPQFQRR
jgi:hypothetical protein